MMTTDGGVWRARRRRPLGSSNFRAKTVAPGRSTLQHAIGSSAGARSASPFRRLKQAWCNGHRTVSPTTNPLTSAP
jgi:hypothetical protein